MKLSDYQAQAMTTADYPAVNQVMWPHARLPIYPALGLAGEVGEFVEKIKKSWRNDSQLDVEAALRELGDVLWYVTAASRDLGSSLEEVATMNLAKLADRGRRGVIKSEGDDR